MKFNTLTFGQHLIEETDDALKFLKDEFLRLVDRRLLKVKLKLNNSLSHQERELLQTSAEQEPQELKDLFHALLSDSLLDAAQLDGLHAELLKEAGKRITAFKRVYGTSQAEYDKLAALSLDAELRQELDRALGMPADGHSDFTFNKFCANPTDQLSQKPVHRHQIDQRLAHMRVNAAAHQRPSIESDFVKLYNAYLQQHQHEQYEKLVRAKQEIVRNREHLTDEGRSRVAGIQAAMVKIQTPKPQKVDFMELINSQVREEEDAGVRFAFGPNKAVERCVEKLLSYQNERGEGQGGDSPQQRLCDILRCSFFFKTAEQTRSFLLWLLRDCQGSPNLRLLKFKNDFALKPNDNSQCDIKLVFEWSCGPQKEMVEVQCIQEVQQECKGVEHIVQVFTRKFEEALAEMKATHEANRQLYSDLAQFDRQLPEEHEQNHVRASNLKKHRLNQFEEVQQRLVDSKHDADHLDFLTTFSTDMVFQIAPLLPDRLQTTLADLKLIQKDINLHLHRNPDSEYEVEFSLKATNPQTLLLDTQIQSNKLQFFTHLKEISNKSLGYRNIITNNKYYNLDTFSNYSPMKLVLGGYHTCILKDEKIIHLFGNNSKKQCDIPNNVQGKVRKLSLGANHSGILTDEKIIHLFGDNSKKQCDIPNNVQGKVRKLSLGYNHSGILTDEKIIHLFGRNSEGECVKPNLIE